MANTNAVAVIIELIDGGRPIRFTVADGATIEKGTVGKISDPRTAAASSADNDKFAGIAAAEKVTGDGSVSLAWYTEGIFDMEQLTGVTGAAGEKCSIAGANIISKVAAADVLFSDVGVYLENAASEEIVAVAVGIYT